MPALKNKVAIVTGASSGIGRAAAKLFAAEGAKVVVAARRSDELNSLVSEITSAGGEAVMLAGDMQSESYVKALVDLSVDRYGGLDVAFNNAGTMGPIGIDSDKLPLEAWERVLTTNLSSAFLGAKYQIPELLKGERGSLIFTSSFVGYTVGFPQNIAYAASKAGLIGLVKSLAAEYGAQGIRVNALLPGGTDTPMAQEFAQSPEAIEFVKSIHALKRLATPEEMAHSALYLASDASSFTTGTALLADGGVSVCRA